MELALTDYLDKDVVINDFCKEVGIKKVKSYIINLDTNEVRYYCQETSKYRKPKSWVNIKSDSFASYVYPDLTSPYNFCMLLNAHWQLFGSLGMQYRQLECEDFPINYILTRTRAIKACKSIGGGEMLDIYIDTVKNIKFDYGIL